jgi:hypothetical protein
MKDATGQHKTTRSFPTTFLFYDDDDGVACHSNDRFVATKTELKKDAVSLWLELQHYLYQTLIRPTQPNPNILQLNFFYYLIINYYFVSKLLSSLTFLFIFDHPSYSKKYLKIIIYFATIHFINKEHLNTAYNFTYLNKYFK